MNFAYEAVGYFYLITGLWGGGGVWCPNLQPIIPKWMNSAKMSELQIISIPKLLKKLAKICESVTHECLCTTTPQLLKTLPMSVVHSHIDIQPMYRVPPLFPPPPPRRKTWHIMSPLPVQNDVDLHIHVAFISMDSINDRIPPLPLSLTYGSMIILRQHCTT